MRLPAPVVLFRLQKTRFVLNPANELVCYSRATTGDLAADPPTAGQEPHQWAASDSNESS